MAKASKTLTPEERAKQEIIDSIRNLTNYKVYTLGQIEKTLGLPQNSLSGMLNGSRNMAPKWQALLSQFIKALPNEDKTITIKIDHEQIFPPIEDTPAFQQYLEETLLPLPNQTLSDLIEKNVAITKTSATEPPAAVDPFSPKGQKIMQSAKKLGKPMPPGLSKSEQIRWHRENGQTLL